MGANTVSTAQPIGIASKAVLGAFLRDRRTDIGEREQKCQFRPADQLNRFTQWSSDLT
jgi:hypothetical protein